MSSRSIIVGTNGRNAIRKLILLEDFKLWFEELDGAEVLKEYYRQSKK